MSIGELLSITAAAALLGRTSRTLRWWADTGRLRTFRGPGKRRYFLRTDVEALRPRPATSAQESPQ